MSGSQQKKRRRFRMEPAPSSTQDAAPVFPKVNRQETARKKQPGSRLSRTEFDALRRAARSVDHASLRKAITTQPDHDEELLPATFVEKFRQNRHPLSSILVSVAFHLAVFLTLMLLALNWSTPAPPPLSIIANIDTTPAFEESSDVDETPNITIELPDDNQSPIENTFLDNSATDQIAAANTLDVIANVVNDSVTSTTNPITHENAKLPTFPTGGGLEGRDRSTRGKLAASRGGSRASETAVEQGLQWIIEHQLDDGSWRLKHGGGRCQGYCANPGKMESTTAATGLALMALLGAGYTHRSGPYQNEIQKALDFLMEEMRISKHGGSLVQGEKGMYSHAIATIALSEAFAMTQDTRLVHTISEARKYIETAQHRKGGWRYIPGTTGDLTVTGWQLMALKSCEMANFPTPDKTWKNAESFIDSLASSSGSYGYQQPEENPTTTAVGVLSKMYLGATLENDTQKMGARLIVARGPSKTNVYFNYYATQVLMHRNDDAWPKWNDELRDYLISTQDHGGNHQAGSWYFTDPHGQMGGRLYTTAMVIMTLEVYYRFMPLYEETVIK